MSVLEWQGDWRWKDKSFSFKKQLIGNVTGQETKKYELKLRAQAVFHSAAHGGGPAGGHRRGQGRPPGRPQDPRQAPGGRLRLGQGPGQEDLVRLAPAPAAHDLVSMASGSRQHEAAQRSGTNDRASAVAGVHMLAAPTCCR